MMWILFAGIFWGGLNNNQSFYNDTEKSLLYNDKWKCQLCSHAHAIVSATMDKSWVRRETRRGLLEEVSQERGSTLISGPSSVVFICLLLLKKHLRVQ